MAAFECALAGKSLFLTGCAGSGKSFLLSKIIEALCEKCGKERVFTTAATGIAACAIGGTTLHWFFGVGLANEEIGDLIKILNRPYKREARDRIKSAAVLILDECSMINAELFDKFDEIAKQLRGNLLQFGGIQLICSGDFYQLPPISRDSGASQFIFESARWLALMENRFFILREIFRQREPDLVEFLAEIRRGRITPKGNAFLISRRRSTSCAGAEIANKVCLFSRRDKAESMNIKELSALPAESEKVFDAADSARGNNSHLLEQLIAPVKLVLRIGARVILLINKDQCCGLVNGATGVVTGYTQDGYPIVKYEVTRFVDGKKVIAEIDDVAEPNTWRIKQAGKIIAQRTQIPLLLAWAITIHKSQGMSIPNICVCASGIFEKGQFYVALSRAVTTDGLIIIGNLPDARLLRPDMRAARFLEKIAK
jgi:ATP-dependent DNA helicase PIF1